MPENPDDRDRRLTLPDELDHPAFVRAVGHEMALYQSSLSYRRDGNTLIIYHTLSDDAFWLSFRTAVFGYRQRLLPTSPLWTWLQSLPAGEAPALTTVLVHIGQIVAGHHRAAAAAAHGSEVVYRYVGQATLYRGIPVRVPGGFRIDPVSARPDGAPSAVAESGVDPWAGEYPATFDDHLGVLLHGHPLKAVTFTTGQNTDQATWLWKAGPGMPTPGPLLHLPRSEIRPHTGNPRAKPGWIEPRDEEDPHDEPGFFLMAPGTWENDAAPHLDGWWAIAHSDIGILAYAWTWKAARAALRAYSDVGLEGVGRPDCECHEEDCEDCAPTRCECDSTHQAADTVCRWCYTRGRRQWDEPEVRGAAA